MIDADGPATGTVSVAGSLKTPVLIINVMLRDAQFKPAATGAMMEHVNGSVRMTGDSVFVDSIAGIALGGWLSQIAGLQYTYFFVSFSYFLAVIVIVAGSRGHVAGLNAGIRAGE